MNGKYTRRPARRGGPAVRLEAAIADDDDFRIETPSHGLGRVFAVVLLLHVVVIGGIMAFKQIDDEAIDVAPGSGLARLEPESAGTTGAVGVAGMEVDEMLPPMRTNGKSIVVEHPYMEGFKRYRVGEDESLVEIVRQFNASVAEVEKLNDLKPGGAVFTGQWLTIPDNTGNAPQEVVAAAAEAARQPVVARTVEGAGEVRARPVAGPAAVTTTPAAPSNPLPVSGERTYKVERGDTAYGIAQRYKVDWNELLKLNGLTDPRQLQAGQVIRIPGNG